uniref:hypothetical protein n=1 Tax=Paenirhodobacter enshiensis TaxID=1105367 RepID=UPI0035B13856
MIEAIPLSILGLFTLTLVFGFVRLYLLWRRREALIAAWRRETGAAPDARPQETLIETRLAPYQRRLTLRLIGLIYGLPILYVGGMILFLNRG